MASRCIAFKLDMLLAQGISGLVVEYIVAIDVTRVRFPADAYFVRLCALPLQLAPSALSVCALAMQCQFLCIFQQAEWRSG